MEEDILFFATLSKTFFLWNRVLSFIAALYRKTDGLQLFLINGTNKRIPKHFS